MTIHEDQYRFIPSAVTIPVGTTVIWVNDEQAKHTATADDGSFDSGDQDSASLLATPSRAGNLPVLLPLPRRRRRRRHGGDDRGGVRRVEESKRREGEKKSRRSGDGSLQSSSFSCVPLSSPFSPLRPLVTTAPNAGCPTAAGGLSCLPRLVPPGSRTAQWRNTSRLFGMPRRALTSSRPPNPTQLEPHSLILPEKNRAAYPGRFRIVAVQGSVLAAVSRAGVPPRCPRKRVEITSAENVVTVGGGRPTLPSDRRVEGRGGRLPRPGRLSGRRPHLPPREDNTSLSGRAGACIIRYGRCSPSA